MNIDVLCVPLDEAKSWLDRFTRREYEKGFRAFCERFGPAYDQAVAEAGEDLTALADAILDAVEERWHHQHFWNRSAVRVNHKQVLVSFLSPMLLDREEAGCGEFARILCARWGERWPKDAYRITTYAVLKKGFRNAIMGIDLNNRHMDPDRDQ